MCKGGVQVSPRKEAWCLVPRTPSCSEAQLGGRKTSVAGGWGGERATGGFIPSATLWAPVGGRQGPGLRTGRPPPISGQTVGPPGSGMRDTRPVCAVEPRGLLVQEMSSSLAGLSGPDSALQECPSLGPTEAGNITSAMRQPGLGHEIKGVSKK